ncbi:MAG: rhomboid family intramembrane serine protease, partial [Spirochaetota bacterium]
MKKLVEELKPVIYTVVLIWGIFIVSSILPFLKNFGIEPRTFFGLFGIFFAPFLHGSFGHIASNTVPLLILLSLVVLNYSKEIVTQAIVCIMVLGGGLVWLFARSSNHIGASGVIYGLAVFLVY